MMASMAEGGAHVGHIAENGVGSQGMHWGADTYMRGSIKILLIIIVCLNETENPPFSPSHHRLKPLGHADNWERP